MVWRKLGIVYCPSGESLWSKTHAMLPTPVLLNPKLLRIYITVCDGQGIGRPTYIDVDPSNPLNVIGVSGEPLLEVGRPGTFDENGVAACSVVHVKNNTYLMYYVGFELGQKIRYRLLTGLAISEDGGNTFKKYKEVPILERSSKELYFRCGPMVIKENDRFKLWYIAGSEWTEIDGKQMPVYSLKYLESRDGIEWENEGVDSLKLNYASEHGFGRPWVIKKSDQDYQLFYSIRSKDLGGYRLGYAESNNGISWKRLDEQMGIDVSQSGFDSEAVMYSAVISIGAKTYCFYNGNNFGESGFAVAELLKE